jgi:hypothetical protein
MRTIGLDSCQVNMVFGSNPPGERRCVGHVGGRLRVLSAALFTGWGDWPGVNGCGLALRWRCFVACAFSNHRQHIANAHRLALLLEDALKHAALLCGNLQVDLIRLQFHQHLALLHLLALALAPGGNGGINYRFSKCRNPNLNWHGDLRAA